MEVHEILTRTISCTLSAWCKSTATSWGCCLASDRHAADTGSIPLGFFSQSQLSVQTLYGVHTSPCAVACIYICVQVKDPVVHVRVLWIMGTLKHPECTVGWVVQLSQLAFPGEGNLNFPWVKSHWDTTVVTKKKKNLNEKTSKCSTVDNWW